MFLFKLHAPQNFIVGGGFYTHSTILPVSLAWEAFGPKNGAATFGEMRAKILRYRGAATNPREDFEIGCILLQQPFFLPEREWIPVPKDFSLNIVQGKTYDADSETGKDLWDAIQMRLGAKPVFQDSVGEGEVLWNQGLVWQRLGQGAFRILVTDTYQRRCAVTCVFRSIPATDSGRFRPPIPV